MILAWASPFKYMGNSQDELLNSELSIFIKLYLLMYADDTVLLAVSILVCEHH